MRNVLYGRLSSNYILNRSLLFFLFKFYELICELDILDIALVVTHGFFVFLFYFFYFLKKKENIKGLQEWSIFLTYWFSARILIGITFICLLRTCANARACVCVFAVTTFRPAFRLFTLRITFGRLLFPIYFVRHNDSIFSFEQGASFARFKQNSHSVDSGQAKFFPFSSYSCWQLLFTFASTKKKINK